MSAHSDSGIVAGKLAQAASILREQQVDCWLTFVRETSCGGDPVLPLILGQELTWQSALLLTPDAQRIAIVGNYDAEALRAGGRWTRVIPYVQSIRDDLLSVLREIKPRCIAVNYSRSDVMADGLSHGMHLLLLDYLGPEFAPRLTSAQRIIDALRGRKTPGELDRLQQAVAQTEELLTEVGRFAAVGKSELDVQRFVHRRLQQRGLSCAWADAQCPMVNSGPASMVGHGLPSDAIRIEPGHIFHLDFGVRLNDYCADLQRCWYVPRAGEQEPPLEVQRAFDVVRRAIGAAAGALRPGALCWQVDDAARRVVTSAGYPEYLHATGHHVGRAAHDGGGVLGPRWERYGDTPLRPVEVGNVFTLELGIENVDGRGYLGLEEMVAVTDSGCRWLSHPQSTLWMLEPQT